MDQDQLIQLSSRIQKLSLDMYKMTNQQLLSDEQMRCDMLRNCIHLYKSGGDITEREDDFFKELVVYGGLKLELANINSQLLMSFQLGLLGSDVCIDFGYQIELLKAEVKELYAKAKKSMEENNPFKDFDEENL